MKIINIQIGKSVQILQIGQPEQWLKLSATAELGDNENQIEAINKLHLFVEESIKSKLPEEPAFTTVPAKKETIADLKKELDVRNK